MRSTAFGVIFQQMKDFSFLPVLTTACTAEQNRALTWRSGPGARGCQVSVIVGHCLDWTGSSDSTETSVRVKMATCLGITYKCLAA